MWRLHGFGIAYQALKLQIGVFGDTMILYANIQTERPRRFAGPATTQ
ncbi:Uncharacterised protein [Salmonella enterica subsp. enterica]|uniref:Uncharacterized protein n=1 Tax=Salmonella enterica I TaxID=59201 RepID=A0A3S4JDY6_SALET|nr:Uncharacterised protein [Salmonella enterica subsp. enterica]